jgi:FixJ family two-component response regulator
MLAEIPHGNEFLVYIIDDDASLADALGRVARAARLEPRTFGPIEEFLARISDQSSVRSL